MNSEYKPLKIVVTGSRNYSCSAKDFDRFMQRALILCDLARQEFHVDTQHSLKLAQGGAKGADELARRWCSEQDPNRVECVTYEADWGTHGKSAGPKRNIHMLRDFDPELVVAFWNGQVGGSGTHHCLKEAATLGIPVLVVPINKKVQNIG